jgi:hypothetical protein
MKTAEQKTESFVIPLPEPCEPKLPAKQETFLSALLSHATIKEACAGAGISETTGWRYLNDEKFKERYRVAQRRVVEHTILRLRADAGEAVKALREIIGDETAPSSARVAAARTILEITFKSVELYDVEARMDALEANLKRYAEKETAREAEESHRQARETGA